MIYTPSKHPKEAFILITLIVAVGIIGTLLWDKFFVIFALLFWMHYTAILSYMQFAKKEKLKSKNITQHLLHPQLRFFLFEFIAVIGILAVFLPPKTVYIGIACLVVWWLFALNFFLYYGEFKKYE